MNNGVWIVVGVVIALLLAGGALFTVFLFLRPEAASEAPLLGPPLHHVEQPRREAPPAPLLRSPASDASDERVGDLQRRLTRAEESIAELTRQLEASRDQMKPLLALYEHAKKTGNIHFAADGTPELPEEVEIVGGAGNNPGVQAADMARKLGFEPARVAAFRKQYEATLAEVQALEKEHAQVSVDGDTTTIRIPRFGPAGEDLRRSWSDWIRSNLTAEEVAAYKKQGGTNSLFGSRMGDYERTIDITEAGGEIRLSESSTGSSGQGHGVESTGPDAARDFILKDYAHLLK